MERDVEVRIRARPEDVGRVREALGELRLPGATLADAALLVTELVSNSIKHAGLGPTDRVRINARWSGAILRVTVRDRPAGSGGPRVVASIRPPSGAESGWGLYLVDRIATRWGTVDDHEGGGYWFELKTKRP